WFSSSNQAMSCVSRLSCLGLPAFCVVVKPRGSQVSPIFEPWVPLAFFQKEFDVSEITGGKFPPSHDWSAQGRIRLTHSSDELPGFSVHPTTWLRLGGPDARAPARFPRRHCPRGFARSTALWSWSNRAASRGSRLRPVRLRRWPSARTSHGRS